MHWVWIGFVGLILGLLALDLGVFHRQAHVVGLKEALAWSGVWLGAALVFNVFVYLGYEHHLLGMGLAGTEPDGRAAAVMFFTGYVIEKSLSVDNVFVISLIFSSFGIPAVSQHRVLFWGILGALVMRGALIGIGAALIARFHWILYVFGALMVLTATKMLLVRHEPDPKNSRLVRCAQRLFPITDDFMGQRFVVRVNGRWMLTPLALALVAVEGTDLLCSAWHWSAFWWHSASGSRGYLGRSSFSRWPWLRAAGLTSPPGTCRLSARSTRACRCRSRPSCPSQSCPGCSPRPSGWHS
jgi:tellurite resistance protein TerC